MEDEKMMEEKPIEIIRRIISIVDLPIIALVNILSRLSSDDILMNCFLVCKYFKNLITELIQQHPHYFTTLYRDNSSATYFLVYKNFKSGCVFSYVGELRSTQEVERVLKKYIDVYDYKIAPTWWTLDRLRCPFDKLVMTSTYSVGGGRGVILSCNGIICAKLNYSIIVTNPVFHHDAILLDYPTCRISSVEKTYLSGMGFGCTRRNCNKFKVLLVESCVYTRDHDHAYRIYAGERIVTIGIDNRLCVKATAKIRTIGTDDDWRVLPEQDCWFLCCHTHTFVTFHGTFFWIGHCPREFMTSTSQCVCVAFDVEEEKARAIELPPEFRHIDFYQGGLVVLRDDLCLYDNITYRDRTIIWKMVEETTIEGALNNFWAKELVLDKAIEGGSVPILKLPTGEILMFIQHSGKSFLYNPNTTKTHYIGCSYVSHVHSIPYIPNFASLKDVIKKGIDEDV